MQVVDIHTHHKPANAGTAIISTTPEEFKPEAGEYYAVGFHPWHLPTGEDSWKLLTETLMHPQVLALGEAGLDKLRGGDFQQQIQAFKRQIEMAGKLGKPLIIHCVKYYNELMELKRNTPSDIPWIIHGFRGKKELAAQLVAQGFYLSFGFLYQPEALKSTPLDALFLESDMSAGDIVQHYREIASLLSISDEKLKRVIETNVRKVFF